MGSKAYEKRGASGGWFFSFQVRGRTGTFVLALLWFLLPESARAQEGRTVVREPAGMRIYQSPYYILHSDLDEATVNETLLRITRMAEEYHERTKDFSGVVNTRMPFYFFKQAEEYYSAGGGPRSTGEFTARDNDARLMMFPDERASVTWRKIQHEGFHQFAYAACGEGLPIWLNEGMAEYFGESLFTGDGFVTGILPPDRIKRAQDELTNKQFKSVENMISMSGEQWAANLNTPNYDMAWSMVDFLTEGDGGKYRTALAGLFKDFVAGKPPEKSWAARIGPPEGFEKSWSAWVLAVDPDKASKNLYIKAAVSSLTSFLGRAASEKQTFANWEEYLNAVRAGTVKVPKQDWLPPSLLASAAEWVDRFGTDAKFEIGRDAKAPQVVAVLEDGTRFVGIFNPRIKSGAGKVIVTIDDMMPKLAAVKALLAEGKKAEAKAILLDAMRRNPSSPLIAEARKLLPKTN